MLLYRWVTLFLQKSNDWFDVFVAYSVNKQGLQNLAKAVTGEAFHALILLVRAEIAPLREGELTEVAGQYWVTADSAGIYLGARNPLKSAGAAPRRDVLKAHSAS